MLETLRAALLAIMGFVYDVHLLESLNFDQCWSLLLCNVTNNTVA
jgi:hypothetical protein